MKDERLSAKQHLKFEKTFYLFGSVSKMVSPIRPDEWEHHAQRIWEWSKIKVEELVTECAQGFIDPPPILESPAAETPVEQEALHNGKTHSLKHKTVIIKSLQVLKSGTTTKGRHWTVSKIVDTEGVSYTTFAGSRYAVGNEYTITYEEVPNGEYIDFRIKDQ